MNAQLKLTIVLLLSAAMAATAQKLPSVQTSGFRAPQTVKIDGVAGDWDDSFQAHNNSVDLFYTIANDDNNLYVVARATEQDVINRVANGGLSIVIYKSGKKNVKDKISITYPLKTSYMYFNFRGRKGSAPDTTFRHADSLMRVSNNKLDKNVKNIGTAGIAGVDSAISIYNENGIKVASKFNLKLAYTIEMAIPLKLLGLPASDATKFTYQIMVNASGTANNVTIGPMIKTDGTPVSAEVQEKFAAGMARVQAQMNAITDCWGEYTLAKK